MAAAHGGRPERLPAGARFAAIDVIQPIPSDGRYTSPSGRCVETKFVLRTARDAAAELPP